MRNMLNMLAVAVMCVVSGCASIPGFGNDDGGGTIGTVQTGTDKLAAQYGIPQSAIDKLRQLAGITDVRKLPGSSRILPVGWTWKQAILDENNNPVDVSKFHRGPPYIVPDGTSSNNTVTIDDILLPQSPAAVLDSGLPPNAAVLWEQILTDIQNDPTLLNPAVE